MDVNEIMGNFPINVFPDVERTAFKKFLKKNVTEDYVKENLKLRGWECYKPFTDTGIDLLATKVFGNKRVYRYIQIKTRALDNGVFGYTLTPKDFVTDPRKIYVLYCDSENDILFLSTYDYLKIFYDNHEMGDTHFAIPSFRNNNNKLNSLFYKNNKWTWHYGKKKNSFVDFSQFVNESGLSKIESSDIEDNFEHYLNEISRMKFDLFYRLVKTKGNKILFKDKTGEKINKYLEKFKNIKPQDYLNNITEIENSFKRENSELYVSHKKYLINEDEEGADNDD